MEGGRGGSGNEKVVTRNSDRLGWTRAEGWGLGLGPGPGRGPGLGPEQNWDRARVGTGAKAGFPGSSYVSVGDRKSVV